MNVSERIEKKLTVQFENESEQKIDNRPFCKSRKLIAFYLNERSGQK